MRGTEIGYAAMPLTRGLYVLRRCAGLTWAVLLRRCVVLNMGYAATQSRSEPAEIGDTMYCELRTG